MLDLKSVFEKWNDEYTKFDRVENPRHPCPDVCAFLLLNELAPVKRGVDMVSAGEHDEIWLATKVEDVAKVATEEQIVELIRCGVRFCSQYEAFAMFV